VRAICEYTGSVCLNSYEREDRYECETCPEMKYAILEAVRKGEETEFPTFVMGIAAIISKKEQGILYESIVSQPYTVFALMTNETSHYALIVAIRDRTRREEDIYDEERVDVDETTKVIIRKTFREALFVLDEILTPIKTRAEQHSSESVSRPPAMV